MQRFSLVFAATAAFFMQAAIAGTAHAHAGPEAHAAASLPSANACSFQRPTPILLPNKYAGQTLERQSDNRMTENARLHNGLRIEVRQSACVDFLTTEFTLIVPRKQSLQLDQDGWIEFARTTIAGLKTLAPAGQYTDLNDFLRRAHQLRPHQGVLSLCRDGSNPDPGECSWESLGGFIFSVKRTGREARVSVTQYLSG